MTRRTGLPDNAWHLDKKVPIALILAILMQTGGMVWWAASASERINALERRAEMTAPQGDRLTRVETRLEAVQDGISEIKFLLRKETQPQKR
jgi:hypothetical protein